MKGEGVGRRVGLVLLPLGLALGPDGLNLVSASVMRAVSPALPVAITLLGVLVGLRLRVRRPAGRPLLVASTLEAGLTAAIVAAGVAWVSSRAGESSAAPWLLALLVGLSASASSTSVEDSADRPSSLVVRVSDLDQVLLIVISGLVFGFIREGSWSGALWIVAQSSAIALSVATAAWLLVEQTDSTSEQHVFAAGALLLLGGAAEYLSLSALIMGLVAGMFWNIAGGAARDRLARDMRYVQHPLIVLLLLVAGAQLGFTAGLAPFVAVYVVCRTLGKVVGGFIVRRQLGGAVPDDVALDLLAPGVVAVALAVNIMMAGAAIDTAERLLTIVVLGTIASELMSVAYPPRQVI